MIPIRYPQLKGKTEAEQIRELVSWVHYLVDQLNYMMSLLEDKERGF